MDPQRSTVDEVCSGSTSATHGDTIPNEASARPEPTKEAPKPKASLERALSCPPTQRTSPSSGPRKDPQGRTVDEAYPGPTSSMRLAKTAAPFPPEESGPSFASGPRRYPQGSTSIPPTSPSSGTFGEAMPPPALPFGESGPNNGTSTSPTVGWFLPLVTYSIAPCKNRGMRPPYNTDEEWINEVMKEANSAQPMDHPEGPCTIFRVPKHIRQLNSEAYKPVTASLGPFHHNRWATSPMNDHKWRCVRHLLSRHRSREHASQLLNECLLELKKQDKKVRSCYAEDLSELDAQDMALIMLLDGCFIIYLILKLCPKKGSLIKKERKKEKGIAKERKEEEEGELEGEATEEDEAKKRRQCIVETRGEEVVLNIEEKDKKAKGIAKEREEEEVGKLEGKATDKDEEEEVGELEGKATDEDEEEEVRELEGEGTEEDDQGKKRREFMIETREGEVVLNIEEKDKKGMGIAKEREEEEIGKLEGEATDEDGEEEVGELEGEATEEEVLNIDKKDEQFEGPTVAGLFTIDVVVYDLLKLENQIPFFIIQLLFDHLKACEDEQINLVDLALQLFNSIHPEESKSFKKKSPGEYHHLLHLFYSSRIPSEKPAKSTSTPEEAAPSQGASTSAPTSTSASGCIPELMKRKGKKAEVDLSRGSPTSAPKWIPSATELDRAGVKFERKEQADSFLNIEFKRRKMKLTPLLCFQKLFLMLRSGRMEIPPLQIYDYTIPLFRNLIAFEQCYFNTEMYITIYTIFMDSIIDRAEDVQLLHLRGILEENLSCDEEVAYLINQLGMQIHYDWEKNYLANQIEEINRFYDFKWHKWLAALRRDYLGNPWATISLLAAVFLLLLTIEQAVFSALSYVHTS